MNSYIKLKNGLIINLSQIEVIGPVVPFNLSLQGAFDADDEVDFYNNTYDLGMKIGESEDNVLKANTYMVPSNSCKNDVYQMKKPEDFGYVMQPYMILLKSGRTILLTEEEYCDINNVMGLTADTTYSNVDTIYNKFN